MGPPAGAAASQSQLKRRGQSVEEAEQLEPSHTEQECEPGRKPECFALTLSLHEGPAAMMVHRASNLQPALWDKDNR